MGSFRKCNIMVILEQSQSQQGFARKKFQIVQSNPEPLLEPINPCIFKLFPS